MTNHRAQHSTESIKREITAIVKELKDPRLQEGFVSILKISSSEKSGSGLKIFVSALEGIDRATEAAECMQSAAGFIRKELGKRLHIRYVPSLKFIPTDALEYAANISKKIDKVMKNNTPNKEDESLGE